MVCPHGQFIGGVNITQAYILSLSSPLHYPNTRFPEPGSDLKKEEQNEELFWPHP